MNFVIKGVGQVFNFETNESDNVLQVQTPKGVISVPTTEETVETLIRLSVGSSDKQPIENNTQQVQPAAYAEETPSYHSIERSPEPSHKNDAFPEGAAVFGGSEYDDEYEEPEYTEPVRKEPARKEFGNPSLGRVMGNSDRSGVPSYTISRVDDKGNPVLPEAPDNSLIEDEEEDPGEQI